MKLLSFGSLPPEWGGPRPGGVASFHGSLLDAMSRRPDVEVVGVVSPGELTGRSPLPTFVRPREARLAGFYEQLLERLRPDVVLMNHVAHAWGTAHARLKAPVPALGFIHSWHGVTLRSGPERERVVGLTREALAGMHAVATCSRQCLEEGSALGFTYPRIAEVVHCPLAPPYRQAPPVETGERHGILFVGSLITRKNPALLVNAASLIPDARVSFAGGGALEGALRAVVDEQGLGERVTFLGSLGWWGVRERLLRSEVMCLPSRSESFGIAYVEALACGTPVVGFAPTVREIEAAMGMSIGEPLGEQNPEGLAAALERVRSRSWDRSRLRERALEVFGLERVSSRLVELLARTVDEARA